MKKRNIIFTTIVIVLFTLVSCGGSSTKTKMPKLNNELDSMNYAYGMFNGNELKSMFAHEPDSAEYKIEQLLKGMLAGISGQPSDDMQMEQTALQVGNFLKHQRDHGLMNDSTLKLNYNLVRQGLVNGIKSKHQLMTFEEAQVYLESTMMKREEEMNERLYGKNKEEGAKFFSENAEKEGIITTESGLQYEVLEAGNGPKPALEDQVKVHYHGTLLNGEVFDSSIERGTPANFGVGQVIPGWIEGLQLMPVGSKYRFYIPYDLAYGGRATSSIPPYSALIFDVELLDIIE